MLCPRCVQDVHINGIVCMHCGYHMGSANERFGQDDVSLKRLTDTSGILRARNKKALQRQLEELDQRFPQLLFAVFFGALPERTNLREFGFWLLNHAAFEDGDPLRPNENGVLLMVDLTSRSLGFTLGYQAERFISDREMHGALSKGQRFLLRDDYEAGAHSSLKEVARCIARNGRLAAKHPEKFARRQPVQSGTPLLRPLRNHQTGNHPQPSEGQRWS